MLLYKNYNIIYKENTQLKYHINVYYSGNIIIMSSYIPFYNLFQHFTTYFNKNSKYGTKEYSKRENFKFGSP